MLLSQVTEDEKQKEANDTVDHLVVSVGSVQASVRQPKHDNRPPHPPPELAAVAPAGW